MEGSSPWPANSVGPGQECSPWPCHLGLDRLAKPPFPHLQGGEIGPPAALGKGGAYPEGAGFQPGPLLRWGGLGDTHLSEPGLRPLRSSCRVPRLGHRFCRVATRGPPPRHPRPPIQAEPPNRRSPSSAPPLRPANPQARLFRPPWRGGAGHAVNVGSVIGPPWGGGGKAAPPTNGETGRA